jgi:hypothetical protein
MKNKDFNLGPVGYFLSLSPAILNETKDLLFDLMEETARAESLPARRKEDRIYLISHLHQLFTRLERQKQEKA